MELVVEWSGVLVEWSARGVECSWSGVLVEWSARGVIVEAWSGPGVER
jgi:hypothetical protein